MIMKKKSPNYLTLLTLLLFLISCQKDRLPDEVRNSDKIEFSFIRSEELTSRASIAPDGNGTFEEGDKISLYVGDGPVKHYILTMRNGRWTPKLNRQDIGTGLVTINARYPADENAGADNKSSSPFKLQVDQNGEGYTASDILWVNRTVNMDDLQSNRIELPFTHGLHRLRITLAEKTGKELPSDLTVSVKGTTSGAFSFFSGAVQPGGSQDMEWITPKREEDGAFQAIVVPQPLKKLQTGDGWIRITANGKSVYYKAPDKIGGVSSLKPGKESVITLRLKISDTDPDTGEDTDAEWAGKKCWVFGITSPVFDPEKVTVVSSGSSNYPLGQWVNFRAQWTDGTYTDQYRLPWKEGCGWYDVSKTYEWDGEADDYMCWAASSSNILHWWMEHNARYIEAYDQTYGATDYYKRYPRPSAVFKPYPARSEIFNGLFVHTFNNRGAGEGVNWFINGSSGYGTSGVTDPDMKDFKGYFKEVFKPGNNLYEHNPSMSKANFNRIIKDALANRKAIAFVTNGDHNMTIWGAEFDEQGSVSYVYYVDNNPYGAPDPGGASMFRKEITYRKDDMMNLKDQTYMGNVRITSLGTVSLQQDIWKQAFPEVQE